MRLAFTKYDGTHSQIYAMDPDGSRPTNLTNDTADNFAAAWSRDGTAKIAYSRYEGFNPGEVFSMNTDGSNKTNLTNEVAINDDTPSWSPDSGEIAFARFVFLPDFGGEIYGMNADGSGQANLTNDPADDYTPSWSPDGTKIAFARWPGRRRPRSGS